MTSNHTEIDKRMLKLIIILKHLGLISTYREFGNELGIKEQNLYKIRKGDNRFNIDQVYRCIQSYQIDPRWVFNGQKGVFLNDDINSKIDHLRVDAEYDKKYNVQTVNLERDK